MKIINEYENIIIINASLGEDNINNIIKKYENFLISNEIKIVQKNKWGIKKLAYKINNQTNGYYYIIRFQANPDIIKTINNEHCKNDKILRFMIVKLNKHAIKYLNNNSI